jgi:hypothetical protein
MRRARQKAREEFISLICEHVNYTKIGNPNRMPIVHFAQKLMRYGATLGRIAENECNGYQDWQGNWDAKAAAHDEAKEARIRLKVTNLCAEFGCKPVFQGDPRGNTLKIVVPDGYTNDWGREGICVPTS